MGLGGRNLGTGAATRHDKIGSADNPLNIEGVTLTAFHFDFIIFIQHQHLKVFVALQTLKFIYGHNGFTPLTS
jgi:hypothetical protein